MTVAERLRDSLGGGAEGQRYRIIVNLPGLWRSKNDLDWRMENLGVQGDGRVQSVTSYIDGVGRQRDTV